MNGEPKVTIEGKVRVRDSKRWKPRYCIVTKASPVANSLQVHLHKELKGTSNTSQTTNASSEAGNRTLSKSGRTTVTLDNFLGVQSGFPLDKESFTLAIFCQDSCVVLALDSRETLALWEARLRLSMPEVCHFDAQLVKVPPCGKAQLGPCRLHIQDHQFSITILTAQGPQVVHSWKIQELRRFGKLDENLYGFEGGSRSGKGEGAHVLMLEDVCGLEGTFQVASHGLLNRQKKSVYNALMADLVSLRERMTSINSLNSASSTTLAASAASSVYGGDSTLRRQTRTCHCNCGNSGGSPNVATTKTDQVVNNGGPGTTGGGIDGNASSATSTSDHDGLGSATSAASPLSTTSSLTAASVDAAGSSANPQLQHGRHPSTASQDTTDSLLALESQASTTKHCDRSSLCSESSGTGSCNGSVGVRSDESSDYDVPKHVAGGATVEHGSQVTALPGTSPGTAALGSSPSSCYDQPKNLTSVTSALKCPCQPYRSATTCSGEHPDSLLNYDIPAQLMSASNPPCSDYDTPKAVADALWNQVTGSSSHVNHGAVTVSYNNGAMNNCHFGPIMEYETIKAITQGSPIPGSTGSGTAVFAHTGFASLLQGQGNLGQGFNAVSLNPQTQKDRLLQNGSPSSVLAGITDAKTRLLFSQRQEHPSGRSPSRMDAQTRQETRALRLQNPEKSFFDAVNRCSLASSHANLNNQLPASQTFAISQFAKQKLDLKGTGDSGDSKQSFTKAFNNMATTANRQLPPMTLNHAPQLLANRRLLAEPAPVGALSNNGLAGTCGDQAIDYVNAQFVDLHLQYPLLEDTHLQNGTGNAKQGLQAGPSVPPAPSLV
ncbi:protein Dok-7-like isoform X2 [Varroa destructor]|uniref:PH domain-containing protein n=1 Tax=Varroa destructor TaxID=109461 RepID=A0A7M7JXJ8_VARDE|nr:protein Dok-7-like isoform X2 [Varroa destructor]XP_022658545.1 protein Dok-7-like isoform X2 [Varroa destructor]XP_022658556.1 protein Dok-7-like isoform X2 [Varroa destructor]XP_022658566.1 protein Dok-7-like isoform X2 [Varroa destructor]XP_022658574.1 protein Dok-7-like isoform X2 [Varroa destructor]XP_022658583.1 protein Dok-7-like isoform X2 [Varroa destructor]XP_022658591.1 protein Dok-7-like isoform X2 [Varroa destructor]